MSLSLAALVRRFVAEARQAPALASGSMLDTLDRAATQAFEGAYVAQTSPVAPITWMSRAILSPDAQESSADPIKLGEPIEIVGFMPTIALVNPGAAFPAAPTAILAPMEAIDVFIEINRRDSLTAQTEKSTSPGNQAQIVNLPHVSVLGPRLMGLILGSADPIMTVKFRWALDLSDVADFGYGDQQISLGMFVRPLIPRREASV